MANFSHPHPQKTHSYYEWLRAQFQNKRAILEEGLVAAGMQPIPSQGGFFLMARLPLLPESVVPAGPEEYDWRYCRMLAEKYGVIGIPASPFFSPTPVNTAGAGAGAGAGAAAMGPMARFAFCKKDETLHEATRRLKSGPVG